MAAFRWSVFADAWRAGRGGKVSIVLLGGGAVMFLGSLVVIKLSTDHVGWWPMWTMLIGLPAFLIGCLATRAYGMEIPVQRRQEGR